MFRHIAFLFETVTIDQISVDIFLDYPIALYAPGLVYNAFIQ
jgi:hypothetical protein